MGIEVDSVSDCMQGSPCGWAREIIKDISSTGEELLHYNPSKEWVYYGSPDTISRVNKGELVLL